MNILMVMTSHDQMGNTGKKTGLWLEEFAAPYYAFVDGGAKLTLASPAGGQPPIDPTSEAADAQTDATRRFQADPTAQQALANTQPLAGIQAQDFDAVFFPGGHGPMWDLAESRDAAKLIETLAAAGKPVSAVCHAPAVFRHTQAQDGTPLVKGKRLTGFSNEEEAAAGLTEVVPFLLEDMLVDNGGKYSRGAAWQAHVVSDGWLITGQNPASSAPTAQAVMDFLKAGSSPEHTAAG